MAVLKFQSSPDSKAGRYGEHLWLLRSCAVSILARLEGRALPRHRYARAACRMVSILARLEGRALLAPVGACSHILGFNPRPTRRPGATRMPARIRAKISVSILARLEGRALHKQMDAAQRLGKFQSSPDSKAGRYAGAELFNREVVQVSILARLEGRALQYRCRSRRHPSSVSILARLEGRALRGTALAAP